MRKFTLLIILLFSFSIIAPIAAQEDDTLRIGYIPILVMEQNFVASDQGWYDELGVDNIEEIRFRFWPTHCPSFCSG